MDSLDLDRPQILLTAIVKPFRVDSVLRALTRFQVASLTVTEVRGYGRQKGHVELYRGREYAISFIPKVKIELVVSREHAEDITSEIERAAQTGRIGDGKIFWIAIEDVEFA